MGQYAGLDPGVIEGLPQERKIMEACYSALSWLTWSGYSNKAVTMCILLCHAAALVCSSNGMFKQWYVCNRVYEEKLLLM